MSADSDYRWLSASPDYYPELKAFSCATPVGGGDYNAAYEKYVSLDDEVGFTSLFTTEDGLIYWRYELEVQKFIRNVQYDLDFQHQWVDLCVGQSHDPLKLGTIYGFVCFAVDLAVDEHEVNAGYVAYIARSGDTAGCGMGPMLLDHACKRIQKQCRQNDNPLIISARIHPENTRSIALFQRHGFEDRGVDPEATAYHRWLRPCP